MTITSNAVPPELQALPADLANLLYPASAAPAFNDPAVVATFKTLNNLTVTWYGFRAPPNRRLCQFYACVVPQRNNGGAAAGTVSLYDIGAMGNNHDVDVLLTNPAGVSVPGMVRGNPGVAVPLQPNNFFQAPRAYWDKTLNPPAPTNDVKIQLNVAGAGCLLWVISYRHGSRGAAPFGIPIPAAGAAVGNQDDDGSPPDGAPGGEAD